MTRKCKNCEGTGERQTPPNSDYCPSCLGSGMEGRGMRYIEQWGIIPQAKGEFLIKGKIYGDPRLGPGDPFTTGRILTPLKGVTPGAVVQTHTRDYTLGAISGTNQTEENKMKLENWSIIHLPGSEFRISGNVYGNPRFKDGTVVSTSWVTTPLSAVVKGAVIRTQNSAYELGAPAALPAPAPEPEDDPGPPYAKAPPAAPVPEVFPPAWWPPEPADDARTWNSHDGGPDPEITAAEGKRFLHASSGIIYEVLGCVWDSGRDRWMLAYKKPGAVRGYAHLPEDFFRPGRFIEVKG